MHCPTWHHFRRDDERDPGDDDEQPRREVDLEEDGGPTAYEVYLRKSLGIESWEEWKKCDSTDE